RVIMRRRQRLRAVRLLRIGCVAVEQDQVHVRACGQLAAAELAHAEDRRPAVLHPPVRRGKLLLYRIEGGANGEVRQIGEGLARTRRIDAAGQKPDADQEFLLGRKDAQPVEEVLKDTSTAEKRLQTVGKVGAVRQL